MSVIALNLQCKHDAEGDFHFFIFFYFSLPDLCENGKYPYMFAVVAMYYMLCCCVLRLGWFIVLHTWLLFKKSDVARTENTLNLKIVMDVNNTGKDIPGIWFSMKQTNEPSRFLK